jgi:acetyltransferase-like isoleucine patch superfamily enzyme
MNPRYLWAKLMKKIRGSAIIDSSIDKSSKIEQGSTIVNSTFDRHSFCGYDCTIINCDVGAFCSIANQVSIGASRHPMEFVSTSPVFLSHKDSVKMKFSRHEYSVKLRTVIESDVWIGEKALIKAGVRIGVGAVIGMGSVVTKDVKPYSIVAGNPARIIRKRFDDYTINALLALKWWTLPDSRLNEIALYFNDVPKLLEQVKQK